VQELQEGGHTSALTALMGVTRSLVPDNVVAAAVNMNILGVITVSLFFGACLSGLGEQGRPLVVAVEVCMPSLNLQVCIKSLK
jgi:Na+/H+-dicarboxylate symporter